MAIDLQTQYQNYKSVLQSLAQKVGEIEQEIEEHKFVLYLTWSSVYTET